MKGIVGINQLPSISKAPHVLLIVGGAVALIPFLGWVGGILGIIGGSLYLAKIKELA